MSRVLVTGCTGFVGRELCTVLTGRGHWVRGAVRASGATVSDTSDVVVVGEIGSRTDWNAAVDGIDTVVHLAAKAHSPQPNSIPEEYMEVNARGTQTLVQAALRAGVSRFVYVSSIKVNGEGTGGSPYGPDDVPQPADPYGKSKLLAEELVLAAAQAGRMQAAIVRPPLVYGPGVRANFLRLLSWVDSGWPLPLGAVRNRRSLVSIWNLCDLLALLLTHPDASGRVWMVSDGVDLSTADLIRALARAMDRKVRLPRVPVGLLRFGGQLSGRAAEVERLCDTLAVDVGRTRQCLGWSPPVSMEAGLKRTVDWYLSVRPR